MGKREALGFFQWQKFGGHHGSEKFAQADNQEFATSTKDGGEGAS